MCKHTLVTLVVWVLRENGNKQSSDVAKIICILESSDCTCKTLHSLYSAQTNVLQEKTDVMGIITHVRNRLSPLNFLSLGDTLTDSLGLFSSPDHESKTECEFPSCLHWISFRDGHSYISSVEVTPR